jgi:DNA mismatch repair protein MutL
MARIRLLDDHLISQIAAGEVIERPASVVKELLENALDAGAGRVAIDLATGGKKLVSVSDDGSGMHGEDLRVAFERHATSKIAAFEDLLRVGSLGFRGEALAAIAAVSRATLTTAREDGEGHRLRVAGDRVGTLEPAARRHGTTVEVESLFFNVPARREFLKTTPTELRRCVEVAQGYALARPDVHFELTHEGRRMLEASATAGEGTRALRERVAQVFGRSLAEGLHEIEEESLGARARGYGLVGGPETTRGRRIFVYVNGRLIRDRAVLAIFYRCVREQWKSDQFPALFLCLEIAAADVDVNVHPQKSEVRFRDPAFLGYLKRALDRALGGARGEVDAPLRDISGERPLRAPAWSGVGGQLPWRASGGSEVREPSPAHGKLAEASYEPMEQGRVRLSGRGTATEAFRVLGQYKGTLLLLEGADGLYLIDQHVAHERVLYERFRRALEDDAPQSQRLLTPQILELSPPEALRLLALAPALEACGFALSELSGGSVGLSAVPASLKAAEVEAMLRELASGAHETAEQDTEIRRRLLDSLAASMSCKAAVKMHQPLGLAAIQSLISELFESEQPYACPHGRPVILKMSDADLERRFGRS